MITIPKHHYVGFQLQHNNSKLLGFATPYIEGDKAFEKRKSTVDSWAARNLWDYIDGQQIKRDGIDPMITDNEPLEGFRISEEIRRSSSWGGGNVVWRIEDPRGFELEISSSNFACVLSCVTMENGIIRGRCVWGRSGSFNILLPENSEPYIEAVKATERANTTKLPLKSINRGDVVLLKDGREMTFYGSFYYLDSSWYNDGGPLFNDCKKYFLADNKTGKVETITTPYVVKVIKQCTEIEVTPQQWADRVTELQVASGMRTVHNFVSLSPIMKTSKIKLIDDVAPSENYPVMYKMIKHNGETYRQCDTYRSTDYFKQAEYQRRPRANLGDRTVNFRGRPASEDDYSLAKYFPETHVLLELYSGISDVLANRIPGRRPHHHTWSYQQSLIYIAITKEQFANVSWYSLVLEYNNKQYIILPR